MEAPLLVHSWQLVPELHYLIRMFGGPLPCCAHDAMVRLVRIASHLGNRYEAGAEESARPKMASTTTPLLMRSGTPQSRTPFAVRHPFYLTSASEDTWGLSRSVCVHLLESCRCCVAVFDGAVLQEQVSTRSTKDALGWSTGGWLPESKVGQEFRRRVWSCRARNVCFMTRLSCCETLS